MGVVAVGAEVVAISGEDPADASPYRLWCVYLLVWYSTNDYAGLDEPCYPPGEAAVPADECGPDA